MPAGKSEQDRTYRTDIRTFYYGSNIAFTTTDDIGDWARHAKGEPYQGRRKLWYSFQKVANPVHGQADSTENSHSDDDGIGALKECRQYHTTSLLLQLTG